MLGILEKNAAPIDLIFTARVAVQMRVGETPLGNSATRTTYIRGIDPNCTREQAMDIFRAHEARGSFEYPVSKVRYQLLINDVLWMDEENQAKQRRREERAARKAQRAAEKEQREAKKAARLAEREAKAAARDAKRAAREAAATAQATLDFAGARAAQKAVAEEVLTEMAAPVVEKEERKKEAVTKKAVEKGEKAPAQKTTRGFTDEAIEQYTKRLDALTAGKPAGSVARLTFKQLLSLGIPIDFLQKYWGMSPQHVLPVTVGGRTVQEIDVGPDRTAEAEDPAKREKLEKELANVDMRELIKRLEKIHRAHGASFSPEEPREGETPLQVFGRIQTAVSASVAALPRTQRRKVGRAINKELGCMIYNSMRQ